MNDTDCRGCGGPMRADIGQLSVVTGYRCNMCGHWNDLKKRGPRVPKPPRLKRWQSNKYCVKVQYVYEDDIKTRHGVFFDSFEEAKADQIFRAEQLVASAKAKLRREITALKRATQLKQPTP